MPFSCSICGEESTRICVRCTKDACDNHLCEKCGRCSDCCECEVTLAPHIPELVREALRAVTETAPQAAEAQVEAAPQAEPEPPAAPVAVTATNSAPPSGSNMLP
jgi:L-lactate utilization protein LutB